LLLKGVEIVKIRYSIFLFFILLISCTSAVTKPSLIAISISPIIITDNSTKEKHSSTPLMIDTSSLYPLTITPVSVKTNIQTVTITPEFTKPCYQEAIEKLPITRNWITFITLNGYKLKYPPDWFPFSCRVCRLDNPKYQYYFKPINSDIFSKIIALSTKDRNKSLADERILIDYQLGGIDPEKVRSKQYCSINGSLASKFIFTDIDGIDYDFVIIVGNSYIYFLSFDFNKNTSQNYYLIYKLMVETFKDYS
jgi:hypothetical protein